MCILTTSFIISILFSSSFVMAINNYIPFVEESAGTYFVAYIGNELLRDFLINVILIATGIIAFAIFLFCSIKGFKKPIFPYFTIGFGIFWLILSNLSAYTISRFTTTLLSQTITGVAIVFNTCFMMFGAFCAVIAVIDFIRQISFLPKEIRSQSIAVILAGSICGYGIARLIAPLLREAYGLPSIFVFISVFALCTGVLMLIPSIRKMQAKQ